MIKATISGVLFTICALTAAGQSKSDSSKTARDFLIEQEEAHGKHPDSRNKNRIEKTNPEKEGNPVTTKPKVKQKKCWFRRKHKKSASPSAKEALENRNTKDPRIDKGPEPNKKANSSAIKDAKK
ncbi:hypothetical protein LL912_03075 [Niabella sp. CC-SYL272]|uniref:hypothetical protein n=1 Tax=Niabella agricola TaxID=2891571 RepID=UPI001F2AF851|nr:hypothetical protein [Niabella agricola]MCF3107754.1 hypothetical protein [Niabella agricola]